MKYLTMNQLREKLGNRSRNSIYRDCESGKIPNPIKLGGRLYWNEADVETALSELGAES